MVTNYPQVLVASDRSVRTATETRVTVAGLMESAIRRVGQIACGVRGHEMLWHYERENGDARVRPLRARVQGMGRQRNGGADASLCR